MSSTHDTSPDPENNPARGRGWARKQWPGERWIFAVVVLPLALAGFSIKVDGAELETTLARDVTQRLMSQGLSGVSVTADGRSISLEVPTGMNLKRAEAVAARVPGVRTVSADRVAASAAERRACADLKRRARAGRADASFVFAVGSVALPANALVKADQLADLLVRCPGASVEVGGHAQRGDDPARLSQQRARAIKALLVSRGVTPSRLAVRGFGDQFPPSNSGPADRVSLVYRVGA